MFNFFKKKKVQEEQEEVSFDFLAALGVLTEIRLENDSGELFLAGDFPETLPQLNGIQEKVSISHAPNGLTLVKESDGNPITERQQLSQEDIENVPADAEEIYFVNLRTKTDDIYSCLIAQPDTQIYGSMRAFWWSLAKMHVEKVSARLNGTHITKKAFATTFSHAQSMWNIVIEESGSIDSLRDQLVPIRNVHLEVISQMKEASKHPAEHLGLEIALAMVLATQCEDPRLEELAFKRFKTFLWQEGAEPKEFYVHMDN